MLAIYRRLLAHILHLANSNPPLRRAEFYALKERLLRRHGTLTGYVVQSFPGQICYRCEGTGKEVWDYGDDGDYEPNCYRCGGDGELIEQFKDNHSGWSETTWEGNKARIAKLLEEFGDLPLSALTAQAIEAYLARRREQDGLAQGTLNRYLAILKTVLKAALRWGYLGYNPADPVKLLREETQIPEALTEEQFASLLAQAPAYAHPLLILAVDTGMRRGEIFRLAWGDVDLAGRAMTVRKAKGGEFRVIPMTARVQELLTGLRERVKQEKITRVCVIPAIDIKKSLHAAGVEAGIGHVHLHQLRHTFATRLLDRGVPIDRIQRLLGHKSLAMVQRYARTRPERLREAIETLDAEQPKASSK